MVEAKTVNVRARQHPLRERYKAVPGDDRITDRTKTTGGVATDPFHGFVVPGSQEYGIVWPFSIHSVVGGDHDGPNPGDLLCAALAACLDSTIRIIANLLGVILTSFVVNWHLSEIYSKLGSPATVPPPAMPLNKVCPVFTGEEKQPHPRKDGIVVRNIV